MRTKLFTPLEHEILKQNADKIMFHYRIIKLARIEAIMREERLK